MVNGDHVVSPFESDGRVASMTIPIVSANLTGLCGVFAVQSIHERDGMPNEDRLTGQQEHLALFDSYIPKLFPIDYL